MAQISTIRNAAKPTIDCAVLSDIHFAIVDKCSILIPIRLIIHANAHRCLNHDVLDGNPYRGHDASGRHDKNSLSVAPLNQYQSIFATFS